MKTIGQPPPPDYVELLDRLDAAIAALDYLLLGTRPAPPRPALRLVEGEPAPFDERRVD
jgi:hypothetical protein